MAPKVQWNPATGKFEIAAAAVEMTPAGKVAAASIGQMLQNKIEAAAPPEGDSAASVSGIAAAAQAAVDGERLADVGLRPMNTLPLGEEVLVEFADGEVRKHTQQNAVDVLEGMAIGWRPKGPRRTQLDRPAPDEAETARRAALEAQGIPIPASAAAYDIPSMQVVHRTQARVNTTADQVRAEIEGMSEEERDQLKRVAPQAAGGQ